jgi:membrane glycosyltransferase
MGLFLTPSELRRAPEQADMHAIQEQPERYSPFHIDRRQGFTRAVVIPRVHALHTALIRRRPEERPFSEEQEAARQLLLAKAVASSPGFLSRQEKLDLLNDPELLSELHRRIWELPPHKGKAWGVESD